MKMNPKSGNRPFFVDLVYFCFAYQEILIGILTKFCWYPFIFSFHFWQACIGNLTKKCWKTTHILTYHMSNFWPFFLEILLFSLVLFALFAGALGLLGGLNLLNLLLPIVLLLAVMGPSCWSCPSFHPSWLWCWFWSPPACTVDLTSSELLIVQKGLPDWVTICLCHVQGSLSLWKWNMLENWQFPFAKLIILTWSEVGDGQNGSHWCLQWVEEDEGLDMVGVGWVFMKHSCSDSLLSPGHQAEGGGHTSVLQGW